MTDVHCELDCIYNTNKLKYHGTCNQVAITIGTTHTCETHCKSYTQKPNILQMQLVVSRIQLIKDSMDAICKLCDEPGDMGQVIAEKFPFAYSLDDVTSEVGEWLEDMEELYTEVKKNAR